jgi:hypothetical protein
VKQLTIEYLLQWANGLVGFVIEEIGGIMEEGLGEVATKAREKIAGDDYAFRLE